MHNLICDWTVVAEWGRVRALRKINRDTNHDGFLSPRGTRQSSDNLWDNVAHMTNEKFLNTV